MRMIVAALCCSMVPAATIAQAHERCFHSPGDHYHAGIAYHLAKKAIPYNTAPEHGICVDETLAPEVDGAMRVLDRYFWKVERALVDDCEERALVEWAAAQGLRFEVGSVVDLKGNRAGRTFRLLSFTQEEMAANRARLEGAPTGGCRPTSVA